MQKCVGSRFAPIQLMARRRASGVAALKLRAGVELGAELRNGLGFLNFWQVLGKIWQVLGKIWQEWRESNPQPPVLETGALAS